MVDGDAPPERFDHVDTMIRALVIFDTKPNFLRKNGLTPAETEAKSQFSSDIALSGFRAQLATRRLHDGPKRTGFRSPSRRFLEIHKFGAVPGFSGR